MTDTAPLWAEREDASHRYFPYVSVNTDTMRIARFSVLYELRTLNNDALEVQRLIVVGYTRVLLVMIRNESVGTRPSVSKQT